MNPKTYIESLFRATPGLELYDITPGTNIWDLVVAPLKQIFEDALGTGELASIEEMRAWETLYDVPLEYLKKLATIRGVHLRESNASSTLVTLYFSSPIDWDIPAGATLSSGESVFTVRDNVSITKGMLEARIDGRGLYYYPDLYVYSTAGDNLDENLLGYMTNAPAELMSIEHPAITNGIADETATTIIEKLKDKDRSITAASAYSIKALLSRYLPGVDITVVTHGSARMTRDMVYNMVPGAITPQQELTYLGKIRRNIVTNPNQAYFASVPVADISQALDDDPDKEFTQGQYLSISEAIDDTVILSTENILNETFTLSSEKIGETSALLAINDTYKRYLYVESDSKYEAGDAVNIADRIATYPTQNGVVEEIAAYTQSGGTYAIITRTITLVDDVADTVVAGMKINVIQGETGYLCYVESVGTKTIVLKDALGEIGDLTEVATDIGYNIVKLYNNLSIIPAVYTNMYVDIVNAEGLYVGPGWIKSEHGMPVGTYINENQIVVINNELVMGSNVASKEINVIKQVFLRYGLSSLVSRIFECMDMGMDILPPMGQWTEPNTPSNQEVR